MSTLKQRIARRVKNAELARQDTANRCGMCKIALPYNVFLRWGDPKLYCSDACLKQAGRTSGAR